MDIVPNVALTVIQGIKELLPASSFHVAVYIGNCHTIVLYFRHTLVATATNGFRSVPAPRDIGQSRLAWAVPFVAISAGLAAEHEIDTTLARRRSSR